MVSQLTIPYPKIVLDILKRQMLGLNLFLVQLCRFRKKRPLKNAKEKLHCDRPAPIEPLPI